MNSSPQADAHPIPADDRVAARPDYGERRKLPRFEPGPSLMRHKRVALIIFLFTLLAGLPTAYFLGAPIYSVQAGVYIPPRLVANSQGGEEFQSESDPQYRDYVQRSIRAIQRVDIAQETLKRLGEPGRRSWLRPRESDRHAAERLAAVLRVSPSADAYQVNVELRNDRPEGLAETVNLLLEVFIGVQRAEEFYSYEGRLAELKRETDQVSGELADSLTRMEQLAKALGVSGFSETPVNPYAHVLESAQQALAEASRQRSAADERFAAVDPSRGGGARRALDSYSLELARSDPANAALLARNNARRAELTARLNRLSAGSPERKEILREILEIDAARERSLAQVSPGYSQTVIEQRRAEMLRAQQLESTMAAEAKAREARAAGFSRSYRAGTDLSRRIDELRKRQESLEGRRKALDLEGKAPGVIRLFAEAKSPTLLANDKRKLLALIFTLAGFVTALIVPIAIDALDRPLLVPADANLVPGMDAIGWLPERKEAGEDFTWELILRLARYVDQERQLYGTRVWTFSSVRSGGGTTTLVNSLGKALSMLGVPALAVEANTYRADSRYARSSSAQGLSALLRGRATLTQSIEAGVEEMPDHIGVGDLEGAGHLPHIHRLPTILAEAAESYAVVLVDLPPLAASLDAQWVARRAGRLVLVAEARRVTSSELKRSARLAERERGQLVACVVNRVHDADGDGFAQAARREFEAGTDSGAQDWRQPRLWK